MRNILLYIILLLLFANCKEENKKDKIAKKSNIIYKKNGEFLNIYDYSKDDRLMMKLKFKSNQFIDTIYYFDYKNHYIIIDSSDYKYFYGTHIIIFDNKNYGYKGALRFTKNRNPMLAFKSQLKFGEHITGNEDGSLNDKIFYVIENDSSIIKAVYKAPSTR